MRNYRFVQTATLAALIVLAVGCSSDSSGSSSQIGQDTGSNTGDSGGADTADGGDGGDANDTTGQSDVRPGTGQFGDTCQESGDCESLTCILLNPLTGDGFCSNYCSTGVDCENNAECVLFGFIATDTRFVCVPDTLCLDQDGDEFGQGPACLGTDCDDNSAGINPAADELCDGIDNDCDSNVDDNPVGVNADCDTGFSGICGPGRTICTGSSIECVSARAPEAELCDGVDNDCDGTVDQTGDGLLIQQTCYNGPPTTLGVGACAAGQRSCTDGFLSDCVGAVLPQGELCNGLDDDCDGTIDDGDPEEGRDCATGSSGACALGKTICDTGTVRCVTEVTAAIEICNGIDDDCDGNVDEDDAGAAIARVCFDGDPRYLDVGECRTGFETCTGGEYGPCIGDVVPEPELCDGVDNDCNGLADDGSPTGGGTCATGLPGVCARGSAACGDASSECTPFFDPSTEICDGLDNDCDGIEDEDAAGDPLTRNCYDGGDATLNVGLCQGGVQTCSVGEYGRCVGDVVPDQELCDRLDNDCDGLIDNDNPEGGSLCPTGQDGICAQGTSVCTPTGLECLPLLLPNEEVCDGLDNDCDGLGDEDDLGNPIARTCYDGATATAGVGICRRGAQNCNAGNFGSCVGQILPLSAELCNGIDDDCDGTVDDGNPQSGSLCSTGQQGVCSQGTTVCTAGAIVCQPLRTASLETCDGLDNDCDGSTDEDAAGAPIARSCYDGVAATSGVGICRAGVQTCSVGSFSSCVGQILPLSTELCDGIDNDCDGTVDDGNPGGGISCNTGRPGLCAQGLTACVAGANSCVANQTAQAESCNGIDDDCDGAIDDGALWADRGDICQGGSGICQRTGVKICDASNEAGPTVCSVTPGAAGTEVCDSLDNDCDGTVDDGALWTDRGTVCSAGQGICLRRGVKVCSATSPAGATECSATAGPAATEVCDGLDNDCDGGTDEDAQWAGRGGVCFSGVGTCRRAGTAACDATNTSGPLTCDAVAGTPSIVEACDYNDDDCDGSVDEDYLVAGVYRDDQNCGACGIDCTAIYDKANAFGSCSATGSAICQLSCDPGFFDLNGVPDDGCEFELDTTAIYVSIDDSISVDDATCGLGPRGTGTGYHPCRTISYALTNRASAATRPNVLVADGAYTEQITLRQGIFLLGGHRASTWERNATGSLTVVRGPSGSGDRKAVVCTSLTSAGFDGFVVDGANATSAGANSYAIYMKDCGSGVSITTNQIYAGKGGPGSNGTVGTSGAAGVAGGAGLATKIEAAACDAASTVTPPGVVQSAGGASGVRQCQDPDTFSAAVTDTFTTVSGGSGGGAKCPNINLQEGTGTAGQNAGGAGGAGGYGHTYSGGGCSPTSNQLETGTNGSIATVPANRDGTGGLGCGLNQGSVVGGEWRSSSGATGTSGRHGAGGGGGGAGGGQRGSGTSDIGGSGGGGGSGGCAAEKGYAGTGGGGSFGIFVVYTTPTGASLPVLSANRISRDFGGDGGDGGNGGAGGDAGAGGAGGAIGTRAGPLFCIFGGASGAFGTRGGHGGGGGGSCGGSSWDIAVWGAGALSNTTYASGNTFLNSAATDTSGTGGSGGTSPNTATGLGTAGSAGSFGNVTFRN